MISRRTASKASVASRVRVAHNCPHACVQLTTRRGNPAASINVFLSYQTCCLPLGASGLAGFRNFLTIAAQPLHALPLPRN
jgi:hypothetical protein